MNLLLFFKSMSRIPYFNGSSKVLPFNGAMGLKFLLCNPLGPWIIWVSATLNSRSRVRTCCSSSISLINQLKLLVLLTLSLNILFLRSGSLLVYATGFFSPLLLLSINLSLFSLLLRVLLWTIVFELERIKSDNFFLVYYFSKW